MQNEKYIKKFYFLIIFINGIALGIDCECQASVEIHANNISSSPVVFLPQNGQEECEDEDFFVFGYVSGCVKKTFFSIDARNPNEYCPTGTIYYKLTKLQFDFPDGIQIMGVNPPHSSSSREVFISPDSHLGRYHAGSEAEGVYLNLSADTNTHGSFTIPVTISYSKITCNSWDAGYHEESIETESTTFLGEIIFDEMPVGGKCDLIIDSVINPELKDQKISEKNNWDVIVRNIGNSQCDECELSFLRAESLTPWAEDLDELPFEVIASKIVPTLIPNESVKITFKETSHTPTYWFNKFKVDSDYEVMEANEQNNNYVETAELFGWYEKKTLTNYGWPVVQYRNSISSVLNEPRQTSGIGRFHHGTDFIKKLSTSNEVLAVSSGRIDTVINDIFSLEDSQDNWYLKTGEFGYFHLSNFDYYNFRGILNPGRWLLKKGIQFFEMNNMNHVHLNDFSTKNMDNFDHFLNPFRHNGIEPPDYENNRPIIEVENIKIFINNEPIELDKENLFGEIEIVVPVKDISSAGFRCGVYSFNIELVKPSTNQKVYASGWQDIGQESMKNENYNNLYNDVISTCGNAGENCPGYPMILTNIYKKKRYGGGEHYEYFMKDGYIDCDQIVSDYGAGEYTLKIKIKDAGDKFISHSYTETSILLTLVENE